MTEIGLILAIDASGLAFALLLSRWLLARDAGGADVRRIGGALGRAVDAFLWSEIRLVGLVAGALAAITFGVHAARAEPAGPLAPLEAAFWAALALALGAGATCVVARVGARSALGASLRSLSAARHSTDRALCIATRTGGAAGLIAETVSVLCVGGLFGLLFAMKGGRSLPQEEAARLTLTIATLLPSFALGVVAAALLVQRAGSSFQTASDLGADIGGEHDAGLPHDDSRNPAVIADLVGDHVGHAAGRTVDLFVSSTALNITVVVVGAALYHSAYAIEPAILGLVFLAPVVRAFGVIASAFGIMVVRTDEASSPAAALWRGQATTVVVAAGGLAGATLWLLDRHWQPFFWAGIAGLAAALVTAHAARYRVDKRFSPLRDVLDALRVGGAPTVLQGLGSGMQAAVIPVLAVAAAMAASWRLGAGTGIASGGWMGSLTAVSTMMATAPYVLAIASFGPIADSARGVSAMASAGVSAEVQRRTSRLDEAGFAAVTVAQPYFIVLGSLAAVLVAAALPVLGQSTAGGRVDLGKPVVLWSGAFGFAVVLAYTGGAVRAAAQGARGIVQEVGRQLRGFPRQQGLPQLPQDFTPSYKASIEIASRSALARLVPSMMTVVALPAVLGVALHLLYRKGDPGLATEALAAFVVVASVTGLGAALAVDGARATLSAARRASRPHGNTPGYGAALTGDAVADVVGNSAGPAANLLIKALAVAALAVAPFLSH